MLEENEGTCVAVVTPWVPSKMYVAKGVSSMNKLVTKSAVGGQRAALSCQLADRGISAS